MSEQPDEEDLFGSEDEAAEPGSEPGGAEGGQSPPPAPAPDSARHGSDSAQFSGPAQPDEEDVLGDLFGSSDEGEGLGEDDLFGSADEAEPEASAEQAPTSAPPRSVSVRSEISEMDEREIFGDVSDDEPEKELSVDVIERHLPLGDLVSMRLPNVISFDEKEYRGLDSIEDEMLEGYIEYKNMRGQNAMRLLNPENCVRWRYEEDEYGNTVLDDGGKGVYESNTRMVEWEDGSWTLFVGSEPFHVEQITDKNPIFEENSKDVYVCHGSIARKFIATPRSMDSTSHEMLKKSQYRKYEPVRRSLLMTEADSLEARQVLDMERETRKTREKRPADGPAMTAGFLEDDAFADGPSATDIKKQYLGRPAKRPKSESPSASASK
ncbi:unnamed protein product [Effrenium voratum]|nr:unnamed protein product [Effrenium voratum]